MRTKTSGASTASPLPVVTDDAAETVSPANQENLSVRQRVHVDELTPNPFQPRKNFDADALADLAHSIARLRLMQAPIARNHFGVLQIADGERRVRAVRLLMAQGRHTGEIEIEIIEATDLEMLELAMMANIKRSDMNAIEEAWGFAEMERLGLTQTAIGEKFNQHQSTVANKIRLLRLPDAVKDAIVAGNLTPGHGTALLVLGNQVEQGAFALRAMEENLSVRGLETLVRDFKTEEKARLEPPLLEVSSGEDVAVTPRESKENQSAPVTDPQIAEAGDESSESESSESESSEAGPEEGPTCRQCDKSEAEIEAAGDHMTKFDLCSACDEEAKQAMDELASVQSSSNESSIGDGTDAQSATSSHAPAASIEAEQAAETPKLTPKVEPVAPVKAEPELAPQPASSAPPAGFTRVLLPEDDVFFCEDNGVPISEAFPLLRRILAVCETVKVSGVEELCQSLEYALKTAHDNGMTPRQIENGYFEFVTTTNDTEADRATDENATDAGGDSHN